MKKISLSVILLLIISCKTTKTEQIIPYILPENVETKLYQVIVEKPESSFCFYLTQKDHDVFEIIVREDTKGQEFAAIDNFNYIKKSNRIHY